MFIENDRKMKQSPAGGMSGFDASPNGTGDLLLFEIFTGRPHLRYTRTRHRALPLLPPREERRALLLTNNGQHEVP